MAFLCRKTLFAIWSSSRSAWRTWRSTSSSRWRTARSREPTSIWATARVERWPDCWIG